MSSGSGSPPLRSSVFAVDSRGFGREIDPLPNDEDVDAGALVISPARCAATARTRYEQRLVRRRALSLANLTAAHHAARSPAIRLTRYFCNRGLEQPTAATRQVLRVVRSGHQMSSRSNYRSPKGSRRAPGPPSPAIHASSGGRRKCDVNSETSAKRGGGPEWNSWSRSSLKYRGESWNLRSMCAGVRREWPLAKLCGRRAPHSTLESRDLAAEDERGRDLSSRYARRPVTPGARGGAEYCRVSGSPAPVMPDPPGL
jgi:hypothetical protein